MLTDRAVCPLANDLGATMMSEVRIFHAQERSAPGMTERPLAGLRVLLIEDDIVIALDVEHSLETAGAVVSGPHAVLEDAVAAAESAQVDLAVLDIDVMGGEVFPAAEILLRRGIPFVFFTGRPDREALRSRFSGIPVCRKPASMTLLMGAVAGLVCSPA